MKKTLILILLIIINLNAKTQLDSYTQNQGDFELQNKISDGTIKKWNGDKLSARVFSVDETTQDLLKLESKFNCENGGIDINSALLDIPEEFKRMYNELFSNATDLIKELAYQKSTDMILNELAGIHYNMVNNVGENGLASYQILSSQSIAQCYKAVLSKSFEGEVEGGVGWNIYDTFSGKFGINASELLSVIDCLDMGGLNTDDAESKEKYAESQKYVRMLFYKILNESMDVSFSNGISEDCKEWDTEKNKKDEISYNIACKGTVTDLSGNELKVGLESEIVPVGTESTSFSNGESNENSDVKLKEKADKEMNNPDKGYFKSNIKYEAILTQMPSFKIKKDTIDILDLPEFKRMILYRFIFDNTIKNLKESNFNHLTNKIKNGVIEVLKRLLFTSYINPNKKEDYLCSQYGTSEYCNQKIYPSFGNISANEIQNKIQTKWLGNLKSEIYNWNVLATGIVSKEQLQSLRYSKKYLENINSEVFNMDYEIIKQSKENLEKYNMFKNWISGGSEMLYTDKTVELEKNSLKLLNYINNNPEKLNNGVSLLEPLNEIDMARLLYTYSSDIVKIKQLLANDNSSYSYIIKNKEDIKNNFFYLDNTKKYIMYHNNNQSYNYTYKELEIIRKNVQMVKDYYIMEYSSILIDRMDSIRSWLYNFEKKNFNMTHGMRQYQKVEIEKIKLKIKQRIKVLKLLKGNY